MKKKKVSLEVLTELKRKGIRSSDFFDRCLVSLKKSMCPVITGEFNRDIALIKRLSQGVGSIEFIHLQERIKKGSGLKMNLYFMYLLTVSDTPYAVLNECQDLELTELLSVIKSELL